jgi:hypothetical protein
MRFGMLQHIVSEHIVEAEKELQALRQEVLQLRATALFIVPGLFKICGHTGCINKTFDWKGDHDFLEINFAGKHVDIKRSFSSKPMFGRNFFSSLFQKKWDDYHVRDKTGRIYVDFKEEWLKPLLDSWKKTTKKA